MLIRVRILVIFWKMNYFLRIMASTLLSGGSLALYWQFLPRSIVFDLLYIIS